MTTTASTTSAAPAASPRRLRVLYFAWVRERMGRAEETVELPGEVETVGELLAWLRSRGEPYALAFERAEVIRAALDQVHVRPSTRLEGAREVAFFPPVTGG